MAEILIAFAHIQLIAIAGAETINPRRAIPKALFRTSIGVFALYVSVIFSIGLILPATHPGLRSSATSGSGSPFAIAAREAGIVSPPTPFLVKSKLIPCTVLNRDSWGPSSMRLC